MQKDFHYDIIFALAKEAGYPDSDANIIAYASQYVDDNTDREYTVSDSSGEFYIGFPEEVGTSGNLYLPIITQAVDITAFKLAIQRYVFAPFHFVPGDNNVSINGKTNPLCTTRGCKNAAALVQEAVKDKDPYRLGVALHTYADTFSHERFSAFHEDWNKVFNSFIGNLPPNIGHGEVFTRPDEISTTWVDERFVPNNINNRPRALAAAQSIFALINRGNAKWSDVKPDFERFMNAKDLNERIGLVKSKYPNIENYDEDRWLNGALAFKRDASEIPAYDTLTGNPQPTRPRFVDISVKDPDARWFRFQSAAKKQLSMVLGMVETI
jgi:hypothetical protein